MSKKLRVAVDNIMSFIYASGMPSTKTATQAKIAFEIQKATKKLRRDIEQQDLIIEQHQELLAEINAITGNTKGSSELRNIVGLLQARANVANKYNKAWGKAPAWANVLLVGDDLLAWASRFDHDAIFVPVEDFINGKITTQKLHLLEGHTWSVIATRPAK